MLESVADTYVNFNKPTESFGSDTEFLTRPTDQIRHGLVQWDLATIASGAVISSTVVTLTVTSEQVPRRSHWIRCAG